MTFNEKRKNESQATFNQESSGSVDLMSNLDGSDSKSEKLRIMSKVERLIGTSEKVESPDDRLEELKEGESSGK